MVCRGLRIRLFAITGVLGMLTGCAGTENAGIQTSTAAPLPTTVPPNYRQIIARNVLAKTPPTSILQVQISAPGVWVGPFDLGKPRPIACIRWTRQGTFGPLEEDIGYTFSDGHIDEVFNFNPMANGGLVAATAKHAYTCGKLTYGPFPEVLKSN